MMWARIQDGRCVEFTTLDPAGRFHPDLRWVEVPADLEDPVTYGWACDEDGAFSPPTEA